MRPPARPPTIAKNNDEQQREKQQVDDHQPHDVDAPPQRADESPEARRGRGVAAAVVASCVRLV